MTTPTMTWSEIEALTDMIVSKIKAGNWQPNMVIGLSRGGFVPATMIAYKLGVKDMAGLQVTKDKHGKRSLSKLLQLNDLASHRVLIVDDGIIGGHLLPLAAESVRSHHGEPRTCALISVGQCPDPDYLADTLTEMPSFPWE